jgi:hypothetical protein
MLTRRRDDVTLGVGCVNARSMIDDGDGAARALRVSVHRQQRLFLGHLHHLLPRRQPFLSSETYHQ